MLSTEKRNPKTTNLDKMTALEIATVMNEENAYAVECVGKALENTAKAIDVITDAFACGGRLIYMGAGTSGRLAVVDASECPPTFGVPNGQVIGICAGGVPALIDASENIEDDPEEGIRELKKRQLNENDVVVGISAAGGAAYVIHSLVYAKSIGCKTVGITSNPGTKLEEVADISICAETGAEVLTGSTRLKAGTAQKLILNMLSTGAMVRSGYVYENMMINLKPTNIKLRARVIRIVGEITGLGEQEAVELLDQNNWVIRDAIQDWKKMG